MKELSKKGFPKFLPIDRCWEANDSLYVAYKWKTDDFFKVCNPDCPKTLESEKGKFFFKRNKFNVRRVNGKPIFYCRMIYATERRVPTSLEPTSNHTLFIIPDTCYCDKEDLVQKIRMESKYLKPTECFGNWWYLHGKLESLIGFDCGVFAKLPDELMTSYVDEDHGVVPTTNLNGVYKVRVAGVNRPCLGVFWTIDKGGKPVQRGLVCFAHDKYFLEHALSRYGSIGL